MDMNLNVNFEDMNYDELEIMRERIARELQGLDGNPMPEVTKSLLRQKLHSMLAQIEIAKKIISGKAEVNRAKENLEKVKERRRKWGFRN